MRMFARHWNVNASNLVTASFNNRFNLRHYIANVGFIKSVFSYENVQLIEIRFFTEQLQRFECDVAVNHVFHSRLGLANVVYSAADDELVFHAVRGLDGYNVTDLCMCDLESITLD